MFCVQCGKPVQPGTAFCTNCGVALAATQEVPAVARGRRVVPVVLAAVVAAGLVAGAVIVVHARTSKTLSASTASATTPPPTSTPSTAATPVGFSELYRQDSSGVIRIETTACEGGRTGTGFLLAPDMVATVAHVVTGAVSLVLRQGSRTTTGTIIGYDLQRELALVRTSDPFPGYVFTLSAHQPDVGSDVAAIGYPLAGEESLSKGAVSGLNRPVTTESAHLTGLIQTDTPINPGNSGGPLLGSDGTVVGLVEAKNTEAANIGFAVPSADAKAQLEAWQADPAPVHAARTCGAPTGPQGVTAVVKDDSASADGPAIADMFTTYATGINTGDYGSAYAVLSPRAQRATSAAQFADGEASSYIAQLHISAVSSSGKGQDLAEVTFTSVQDAVLGGNGQSCSVWQMTYTLVTSASGWQIDRAKPHAGSPAAC